MESLKELYRIGTGPSSSHTMGPERAAHRFKEKYPQADRFLVTLYGSLAKTGKGHLTDDILVKTFAPLPVEIRFDLSDKPLPHPNTLELTAIENDKEMEFVKTDRRYQELLEKLGMIDQGDGPNDWDAY